MSKERIKYSNLYSTSGNESLFEKVEKKDTFATYHLLTGKWTGLSVPKPCLEDNIELHHRFTNEVLFEMSIHEKLDQDSGANST